MSKRDIKACLKLCKEMSHKFQDPYIWNILLDFEAVFKRHQALLDVIALDPLNKRGTFFKFGNKVVRDFLKKAEEIERSGNIIPILVKEALPKEILDGIEILKDCVSEIFKDNKTAIYYFSISFEIPVKFLDLWVHPIRYTLVSTEEEAKRLSKESFEVRAKEMMEMKEKPLPSSLEVKPESSIETERLPFSTIAEVLSGGQR